MPAAELDGAGNVVKRFVYAEGVNVPELMVTVGATYRLVKDHLGSVRYAVDVATGAVAQELRYDAWGRVLLDTNPELQPFGYAGGLYDADTGLVRFGVREYEAEVGRWTSKDPVRLRAGDTNLYRYGDGDPVNRRDPAGRDADDVAACVACQIVRMAASGACMDVAGKSWPARGLCATIFLETFYACTKVCKEPFDDAIDAVLPEPPPMCFDEEAYDEWGVPRSD